MQCHYIGRKAQVLVFLLFSVEKAPGPSLFDQKVPVTGFDQQQPPVKVVYYRALYPFDARSHDEISIAPGDVIMVCTICTQQRTISSHMVYEAASFTKRFYKNECQISSVSSVTFSIFRIKALSVSVGLSCQCVRV